MVAAGVGRAQFCLPLTIVKTPRLQADKMKSGEWLQRMFADRHSPRQHKPDEELK
ncbi:MAG: hypothetical protein ABI790_04595 [Betaproteobacteria bacterium]